MKFQHEMMPIFRTEFSEFRRRGLGHTYTRPASISAIFGFKCSKTSEFTEADLDRTPALIANKLIIT